MEFEHFRNLQRQHIAEMLQGVTTLFTVNVDPETLWNTYLDSFPPGTNEIFRQRREFDCSCCRHFVKHLGHVVAIKEGRMVSIWGFETEDDKFQPVVNALNDLVLSCPINGVFVTKESAFGTEVSHEHNKETGEIISWRHFWVDLPRDLVYRGSDTLDGEAAKYRVNREVLESSLQQIGVDAIETALDLIAQNSLYRGEEWKSALEKFLALKWEYDRQDLMQPTQNNNWLWVKSVEAGPVVGRIKNHSIGTFLLDLSQGTDLDTALRKYEAVVAPTNYKRPQAVFTPKMVEAAKKTVVELGLQNSLGRRFARLEDVSINDVLFADRSVAPRMSGDAFSKLAASVPVSPKSFERVEEISAEKFVADVMPRSHSLQVLVENRHLPNLVSLIGPQDKEAPTLFKWENNFSWVYNGNIADSMKQRVAKLGGKVDGVLRFSIQWNEKADCPNDFDAHCIEPNGDHIYYANKRVHSGGWLDIDIISPGQEIAIENIAYPQTGTMREGVYTFSVHCFDHRGGKSGFAAEIEFGGEIFSFEYRKDIPQGQTITVAKVRYRREVGFEIIDSLPTSFTPQNAWGITTNNFVPVLAVMYSPNYWLGRGVGNRHVIFALKGCVNDGTPNGFFNEYLKEDLMQHKRVFEALGREMRVEPSDDQLSGLGFATTQRNSLVVKVIGATERIVRVTF